MRVEKPQGYIFLLLSACALVMAAVLSFSAMTGAANVSVLLQASRGGYAQIYLPDADGAYNESNSKRQPVPPGYVAVEISTSHPCCHIPPIIRVDPAEGVDEVVVRAVTVHNRLARIQLPGAQVLPLVRGEAQVEKRTVGDALYLSTRGNDPVLIMDLTTVQATAARTAMVKAFAGAAIFILMLWTLGPRWRQARPATMPGLVLAVGTPILIVWLYRPFLFGDAAFIFADSGLDQILGVVPVWMLAGNWLRDGGIPAWSFGASWGTNIFALKEAFDPFTYLQLALSQRTPVDASLLVALLKMAATIALFYGFLRRLTSRRLPAALSAVMLGLSGYSVLWGQFSIFGTGLLLSVLVIWATERWLSTERWGWVLLSVTLLLIVNIYFAYVTLVFCLTYVIFRHGWIEPVSARTGLKAAGLVLLSAACAAPFLFPSINNLMGSARMGGALQFDLLTVASLRELTAFAIRALGNYVVFDGGHTVHEYFGNYFKAPVLYATLLPFLLIPASPFLFSGRKRWICAALIVLGILSFLFPAISAVMEGMVAVRYRWMFILTIMTLILTALALDLILHTPQAAGTRRVLVGAAGLNLLFLAALSQLAPLAEGWSATVKNMLVMLPYMGLITGYAVALLAATMPRWRPVGLTALCCLVLLDMGIAGEQDIARRPTLSRVAAHSYYDDLAGDAGLELRRTDASFFRLQRNYLASWNDPMAAGYFGTSGYFPLQTAASVDFLNHMGIPFENLNVVRVPFDEPVINALLAVRYAVVADMPNLPDGYEVIGNVGDRKLLRNNGALPLGVVYHQAIGHEDWLAQPVGCRVRMLAHTAVLDPMGSAEWQRLQQPERPGICDPARALLPVDIVDRGEAGNIESREGRLPQDIKFTAINNDPMLIVHSPVLVGRKTRVSMIVDSDLYTAGQIFWARAGNPFAEISSRNFLISPGRNRISLELANMTPSDMFRLDIGTKPGRYGVSDFQMEAEEADDDSTATIKALRTLAGQALTIEQFAEDHIRASVTMTRPGVIHMSIPFDPGWRLRHQDGAEIPVIKVNGGFVGAVLPAGMHRLEFRYGPPGLHLGLMVGALGLIALIALAFISRRGADRGR